MKDTAKGTQSSAQYSLTLHNKWENATNNPLHSWPNGTHQGQSYETRTYNLDVPRIDGPQTNKTWEFASITVGLKTELKTNFGAEFKLGDWLNTGSSFESTANLEVNASYEATAPLLNIDSSKSALPCINYIVRTDHKLLDHFLANGWNSNLVRSDGKWEQSADLPLRLSDLSAGWLIISKGQPIEP